MILEDFKNKIKKFNSEDILRILIGLVFLSAGIFRIFNVGEAELELKSLHLSNILSWPLIILEIFGGLALLFKRYFKTVTFVFIIFLFLALVNALYLNGLNFFYEASELFVFSLNSTDFFLHFVFLIILISFLMKKK